MIETKKEFVYDKKSISNIEKFFASNHKINIGILANSTRPDGFGAVELALVHEFGSQIRHIPQRSFLRKTMTNKRDAFSKELQSNAEQIMKRIAEGSGDSVLQKSGALWVRYVMETFDDEGPGWKKLSPKTIANRINNSDKILQDTGAMKRSITYEVK